MIYEFAVDPKIFSNFHNFRILYDKFGFSKARVISEFPSKWKREVYKSASSLSEVQKKKIELWLRSEGQNNMLVSSGRDYIPSEDWLNNAEIAHKKYPFYMIVSNINPNSSNNILIIDDNTIPDDYPKFKCPTEIPMPKTEEGFKMVAGPLLKFSKNIIFIDPYFFSRKDNQKNFGINLYNLLSFVSKDAKLIRYCTGVSTNCDTPEKRISDLNNYLPRYIPRNISIEIVLLKKTYAQDDHNRFILTEKGGIKFPWGLDIRSDGPPDTVNLLDENIRSAKYEEFFNLSSHDVYDKLTISHK